MVELRVQKDEQSQLFMENSQISQLGVDSVIMASNSNQ